MGCFQSQGRLPPHTPSGYTKKQKKQPEVGLRRSRPTPSPPGPQCPQGTIRPNHQPEELQTDLDASRTQLPGARQQPPVAQKLVHGAQSLVAGTAAPSPCQGYWRLVRGGGQMEKISVMLPSAPALPRLRDR